MFLNHFPSIQITYGNKQYIQHRNKYLTYIFRCLATTKCKEILAFSFKKFIENIEKYRLTSQSSVFREPESKRDMCF